MEDSLAIRRHWKLAGVSWLGVIAACGDATGPSLQTWDLEVGLFQVVSVESCDGSWFSGGDSGVGQPGEFVWQVTLTDPDNQTTVIDETDAYPDVFGQRTLIPNGGAIPRLDPVRMSITVPAGETREFSMSLLGGEWDGSAADGWQLDPRIDETPAVVTVSSLTGFSPGRHTLDVGGAVCGLQARVDVTATLRTPSP